MQQGKFRDVDEYIASDEVLSSFMKKYVVDMDKNVVQNGEDGLQKALAIKKVNLKD